MNDFQQAIIRLKSSPHYQKLATYKPPFDPFEVMGVPYRELSHSKVLGWLLSDDANGEFRQKSRKMEETSQRDTRTPNGKAA